MSADTCNKHQTEDSLENPCVLCLLEKIKEHALHGKKSHTTDAQRNALDLIYQAAKNRLTLAAVGRRK